MICLTSLPVKADATSEMTALQVEMLRLISTPDRETFMKVTEQLKAECQKYGDERLFYIAWGNQSTYEATHQNYQKADEIVNEINDYAEEQNSFWGHYIALHTKAVNDLQKQDY
jgi:hypothetical protein